MREQLWCSKIAAAVGLDPWSQPYDVWNTMYNEPVYEKTGPTPNQIVGKAMEPVIAQLAEPELGPLEYVDDRRITSKALPWLSGRVEYLTPEGYPVDCKNVGVRMMDQYDKETPSVVAELQVRAYLALLNVDRGYISAWLGGGTHRLYEVNRDMDKEATLALETEAFVKSVIDGAPPDLDMTHRSTEAIIKALYPDVTEAEITLGDDVLTLQNAKEELSDSRNRMDKGVKALDLEIKLRLGNAYRGWLSDGSYIERKAIHVKAREQAAFDYIKLYRKTVKV